jgi:hypothetical protein
MTIGSNHTESTQSLTSTLHLLRTLTEPAFVVHVGAGRGVGELHTWHSWALPKALIVDSDVNRLGWAQQLCVQQPAWKVAATVISNGGPEVSYHLASNPDEDSLVPMESLTCIWPNIRAVKVQTVPTLSLDQLLSAELAPELEGQHSAHVWCLIDCLPADLILLGAEHSLAKMSVVVARVILTNHQSAELVGLLSSLSPFLQGKGFKCLSVLESTHPSIGYAVFVRDYKATHEEYVELVNAQLQTERVTIAQQNEKLSEQRLQLDRLMFDRDTQLDTVTSQAKTIEAQLLEIDEVKQQLIRMEALVAESDQGKLALQGRQDHLHDDLVRAEAQIDLIKELMFSSPQLKG